MTAEEDRTRLIGEIARILRDGRVPDEARAAALTFIGWLARRMPGEPVSRCDLSQCKGRTDKGYTAEAPSRDSGYAGPPSGPVPRVSVVEALDPTPRIVAESGERPRTAR